jgi:hypothetical protein
MESTWGYEVVVKVELNYMGKNKNPNVKKPEVHKN